MSPIVDDFARTGGYFEEDMAQVRHATPQEVREALSDLTQRMADLVTTVRQNPGTLRGRDPKMLELAQFTRLRMALERRERELQAQSLDTAIGG